MPSVTVFDPAMCCSTGVCGPQVEPHLARFEADLRWLSAQGAQVTRHNLGQEPGAFAGNDVVRTILQSGGEQALPVILLDGRLRWAGTYPTRDELAATLPQPAGTAAVEDVACCSPGSQDTAGQESEQSCCAPAPTLQVSSAGAPGGCC